MSKQRLTSVSIYEKSLQLPHLSNAKDTCNVPTPIIVAPGYDNGNAVMFTRLEQGSHLSSRGLKSPIVHLEADSRRNPKRMSHCSMKDSNSTIAICCDSMAKFSAKNEYSSGPASSATSQLTLR